jgi:uncharacterized protein
MRLENSFEVPAPPDQAWELLLDVPRVVPCMPGATLTETVDESHWKATVDVKLGPVALSFLADVAREEEDVEAKRVRLVAKARDARGRGSANATIDSSLVAVDAGTRVDIVTDLQLSGPAAQFGRSVVPTVAAQLTADFAECLKRRLDAPAAAPAAAEPSNGALAPPPTPEPERAEPMHGFALVWRALLRRLRR